MKRKNMVRDLWFVVRVLCVLCVLGGGAFGQTFKASSQSGNTYGANTDLNAVSATATATSTPFPYAAFFKQQAELYISWSGTTGSPSGCTIQVKATPDDTTFFSSGSAISVTPGTSAISVFTGAIGVEVEYTYACATYPTAGTLTLKTVYK
jgi:hypothetical protein